MTALTGYPAQKAADGRELRKKAVYGIGYK
jgi:hypothetical protein